MAETIKVLHIIRSLSIGGIETQLLDTCMNYDSEKMEIHVICTGGGELVEEFRKSKAFFNLVSKLSRPYDLIDLFLVYKIRRYIQQHNIQLVHAHFADEGMHAYAACIGLKNVKVVQGLAVDFRLNRKIDNRKFRFLCKSVDAVVSLTNVLKKQAIQYTSCAEQKIESIYGGIDHYRIRTSEVSNLKEELKLDSQVILGGMLGNFYNQVRNQFEVCKALKMVMQQEPNFHFVFAGGDKNKWVKSSISYFDQCVNYCEAEGISNRVHFLGLRKDPASIYQNLDFYVHSTNYDTFGMAPIEAAFNNLTVIANDHPVFKETSDNGNGMLLYQTGNLEDFANKILLLIQNSTSRETLAKQHYDHAEKKYTIQRHLFEMEAFYRKVIEKT